MDAVIGRQTVTGRTDFEDVEELCTVPTALTQVPTHLACSQPAERPLSLDKLASIELASLFVGSRDASKLDEVFERAALPGFPLAL